MLMALKMLDQNRASRAERERQARIEERQGRMDARQAMLDERNAEMAGLQMQQLREQMAEQARARAAAVEQQQRRGKFLGSIDATQGPALPMGPEMLPAALLAGFSPQEAQTLMPSRGAEPKYMTIGNNLVQITRDGKVTPVFQGEAAPKAPPSAVQEYEYAIAQGFKGSFEQWKMQQATASRPTTNISVGDNKFDAKAAEVIATQFSETWKQGQAANRSMAQINRLDELLTKTGGGFTAAAQAYAGQFGINTRGLSDIQAADAIIQSLIPQQRPPGSGTMSDRDIELFRQSVPRLINQPGGNQKIIATMRGIAEYDRKMGQIASDALAGKISRQQAMEMMNELPNPLAQFSTPSGGGWTIKSKD